MRADTRQCDRTRATAAEEAFRQGVEVIVVHDQKAAEPLGGLAAILRFG